MAAAWIPVEFNIADGAKLEFRNGAHTLNNVTTSGLGIFQISTENVGADATVTVNGGTHTTAFLLSGSAMNGTDHTFQGPVTWTGGGIGGDGLTTFESTTFQNDVTISGPNLKTWLAGVRLTWRGRRPGAAIRPLTTTPSGSGMAPRSTTTARSTTRMPSIPSWNTTLADRTISTTTAPSTSRPTPSRTSRRLSVSTTPRQGWLT